jgi:hypothetical protein
MPFILDEQVVSISEEESPAATGELLDAGKDWFTFSMFGVVGSVGGVAILGGLALCYWRYHRQATRRS